MKSWGNFFSVDQGEQFGFSFFFASSVGTADTTFWLDIKLKHPFVGTPDDETIEGLSSTRRLLDLT